MNMTAIAPVTATEYRHDLTHCAVKIGTQVAYCQIPGVFQPDGTKHQAKECYPTRARLIFLIAPAMTKCHYAGKERHRSPEEEKRHKHIRRHMVCDHHRPESEPDRQRQTATATSRHIAPADYGKQNERRERCGYRPISKPSIPHK